MDTSDERMITLYLQGEDTEAIAQQLGVSPQQVRSRLSHIRKTGVNLPYAYEIRRRKLQQLVSELGWSQGDLGSRRDLGSQGGTYGPGGTHGLGETHGRE
jgi:DNA-binding Lrp family transcriptional regulator